MEEFSAESRDRMARAAAAFTASAQIGLVLVLALMAFQVSGCTRGGGQGASSITLAGSTSVQPFAEMLAEEYGRKYPDRLPVNVQGGGSSAGARAAMTGAAQVGMMSRGLAASETELTGTVIAQDAVAVIVHPSNPLSDLTKDQIRGIFAGKVTDWEQLGGLSGKIHVVSREEGSGTRGAFDELIMEGEDVLPRAIVQDSNGAVRETVAGDKAGIGYVSLGLVDSSVKALRVGGAEATVENVRSETYTLVRPFLFVAKGQYSPSAKEFVDYVLSQEGRQILAGEGLVTPE